MTQPPAPTPPAGPGPRPGPGASGAANAPLPSGLLPTPVELEEMPVREHVALFEGVHRTLAERLDDAGA